MGIRRLYALQWLALAPLTYVAWTIYTSGHGGDAHAYWSATGYSGIANGTNAFLYTPPVLLAMQPLHLLPWELFRALFMVGQLTALVWMTGPILALVLILPGHWSPVWVDLYFGNVMIFSGALAVAGFRSAYWWSVLPQMKLTPGVALLWSGWRPIALAAGIVLATVILLPGLWADWLSVVTASTDAHPLAGYLMPRVAIAAGLVLVGRWRGWRWTVVLAVMLAQPVLWFTSFAILVGWIYQLRHGDLRLPTASVSWPQTARIWRRRTVAPVATTNVSGSG